MDADIWAIFQAETGTYLDSLEHAILEWENGAGAEYLNDIYRYIHTIKGNAGIVGFDAVEALAHALEDLIQALRTRQAPPESAVVRIVLDNVDWIGGMIDRQVGDFTGIEDTEARIRQIRDCAANLETGRITGEQVSEPEKQEQIRNRGSEKFAWVSTEKIDGLIALIGEILISGAGFTQLARDIDSPVLNEKVASLNQMIDALRNQALELRMTPISDMHQRCRRIIRDLAAETGKSVEFRTAGGEIEIDKTIMEHLTEPLVHLIRNAVDHGMEDPEERRAAGKRETGIVELNAWQSGGFVHLRLSDDGKGIDTGRVLAKAVESGLIAAGSTPTEEEILDLLFHEGFSTADMVTRVSGRGIGLYAVRKSLETIRGSVSLGSRKGRGSVFELRIPMTLSISTGMLLTCGNQSYIVPIENVRRCLEVDVKSVDLTATVGYRNIDDKPVAVINLARLFGLELKADDRCALLIVSDMQSQYGILVDRVEDIIPFVIKPVDGVSSKNSAVLGSTILGTGKVVMILDTIDLCRQIR